jgi:dipeptidyl aminopeptidase/acylaminoacyl peptidase
MIKQFEVQSGKYKIRGVFAAPEGNGKFPCVILSHGLISSKESSKYLALSQAFQDAGIASCRFDFHGCGESEGNIEETTLSIRVENLESVTEWVLGQPVIDIERMGLLGSSFGGSTSLVKAARDKRIKCISLWATPHMLERKEESSISEIDFRDTLYEDFARYDLLAEAGKTSCALVIHGEMDDVVPAHEGKAIYKNLKKPKRFELIKGGDHIFSDASHREKVIRLSLNWFRRYFSV